MSHGEAWLMVMGKKCSGMNCDSSSQLLYLLLGVFQKHIIFSSATDDFSLFIFYFIVQSLDTLLASCLSWCLPGFCLFRWVFFFLIQLKTNIHTYMFSSKNLFLRSSYNPQRLSWKIRMIVTTFLKSLHLPRAKINWGPSCYPRGPQEVVDALPSWQSFSDNA